MSWRGQERHVSGILGKEGSYVDLRRRDAISGGTLPSFGVASSSVQDVCFSPSPYRYSPGHGKPDERGRALLVPTAGLLLLPPFVAQKSRRDGCTTPPRLIPAPDSPTSRNPAYSRMAQCSGFRTRRGDVRICAVLPNSRRTNRPCRRTECPHRRLCWRFRHIGPTEFVFKIHISHVLLSV